jgi:hypothetical protein
VWIVTFEPFCEAFPSLWGGLRASKGARREISSPESRIQYVIVKKAFGLMVRIFLFPPPYFFSTPIFSFLPLYKNFRTHFSKFF